MSIACGCRLVEGVMHRCALHVMTPDPPDAAALIPVLVVDLPDGTQVEYRATWVEQREDGFSYYEFRESVELPAGAVIRKVRFE